MADEKTAPEAEVDVDSLDDKAFEDLKSSMRGEPDEGAQQQAEEKPSRARDEETGRFAKTEQKPEGEQDSDEAGRTKTETVPHAKFHRANERAKQAEAERDQMKADREKAYDRLRQLLELQQAPAQQQKPEETVPRFTDDPVKAGQWMQDQILTQREQEAANAKAREQQTQQDQVWNEAYSSIGAELDAQAKEDPTVVDAYNYLRESMGREMLAMGYTRQAAIAELDKIERQHILFMAQNRLDPGDYLKGLSQARGWAPKPAAEQQQQKPVAEQIAQREDTRKASLSLGKTGGGVTNTGAITPEQLLEMSDAEFDAYKKKHGSVSAAFLN